MVIVTKTGRGVRALYVQTSVITRVCAGVPMGVRAIRTTGSSVVWREKPLCLQTAPKLSVIGSSYLT